MKSIALLLLLIGIILIVLGISKTNKGKCPTDIEYRTVSNNYLEDVLSSQDNYKSIFNNRNIGIPDISMGDEDNADSDNEQQNIHNII